jgi:hypothetical protein
MFLRLFGDFVSRCWDGGGAGTYVRTRDAFITIPRVSFKDWKDGGR